MKAINLEKNHEKCKQYIKSYWVYYTELEKQMLETRRYVDFSEDNFQTYSVEYLKLYQAVCSEIDVFAKTLATELDPDFDSDKSNITKWWFVIQDWYEKQEIKAVSFCKEFELNPWENYKTEWVIGKKKQRYCRIVKEDNIKTPEWWDAYTDVKHKRTVLDSKGILNYKKANLKNLSSAFAALYILERCFFNEIADEINLQTMGRSLLFERDNPVFSVEGENLIMYPY